MFTVMWHFFIPLTIFVVAYWKIFGVIRRHATVGNKGRQEIIAVTEPTAGPSGGKTAETCIGSTTDENPRDKGDKGARNKKAMAVGLQGNRQGGGQKTQKTGLSEAQINVVTTMVFITVCFALCWMPMYIIIVITQVVVRWKICYQPTLTMRFTV